MNWSARVPRRPLVGSIPLDTPEAVFREFGGPLGSALKTMPMARSARASIGSAHPLPGAVRPCRVEDGAAAGAGERRRAAVSTHAADSWLFRSRTASSACASATPAGGRLCARRHQLLFRIQDAARARRTAKAPALPGVACLGQQRAAPRIFPDVKDVDKIRPGFTDALAARSTASSSTSPTTIWRSNGIVRPRCRTLMARCRAIRRECDRAQHRAVPHPLARAFRKASSSATISASARSAAGRVSRPRIFRRPYAWAQRHIEASAAASFGFTSRPARRQGIFFAPLKDLRPRGARVYSASSITWTLQGAHCAGAEVSAGIRARGLLRLRPHPASEMPAVLNEHLQAIKAAR